MILTLGLATPWARVRLARFRAGALSPDGADRARCLRAGLRAGGRPRRAGERDRRPLRLRPRAVIRRRGRYFDGTSSRATDVELALYADGHPDARRRRASRCGSRATPCASRRGSAARRACSRCRAARAASWPTTTSSTARSRWPRLAAPPRPARAPRVAGADGGRADRRGAGRRRCCSASRPWRAYAARSLPAGVDAQLGESTLAALDEASSLRERAARRAPRGARARSSTRWPARRARAPASCCERAGASARTPSPCRASVVVLTDELTALAPDDDEIAAVLAHELGHVARAACAALHAPERGRRAAGRRRARRRHLDLVARRHPADRAGRSSSTRAASSARPTPTRSRGSPTPASTPTRSASILERLERALARGRVPRLPLDASGPTSASSIRACRGSGG